jgi:hypothetical protein
VIGIPRDKTVGLCGDLACFVIARCSSACRSSADKENGFPTDGNWSLAGAGWEEFQIIEPAGPTGMTGKPDFIAR